MPGAPGVRRHRRRLAALAASVLAASWSALAPATTSLAPESAAGANDLLVVGAGSLGTRAALLWKEKHPDARILAATMTTRAHERLRDAGLEPITVAELQDQSFPHVLFAAPPSGTPEEGAYAAAVEAALQRCTGTFVFTSSASVFAEDNGGDVDEASPLTERPGAQRLLSAERPVLEAGGTVLRYAGLYDADTGPHAYWLKVGVVKGNLEGLINLVHYDDAASAAVAALAQEPAAGGRVFVIADGEPVTRKEICESTLASKRFGDATGPRYEQTPEGEMGGKNGKRLLAARARAELGWRPRFASFPKFMAAI